MYTISVRKEDMLD